MSDAWPKAWMLALFGNLHRRGGVGVLRDDVDALVDQRLGGIGFLARVEPGVHPDDLELEIRIDRTWRRLRRN
jgi:hypothetical protein